VLINRWFYFALEIEEHKDEIPIVEAAELESSINSGILLINQLQEPMLKILLYIEQSIENKEIKLMINKIQQYIIFFTQQIQEELQTQQQLLCKIDKLTSDIKIKELLIESLKNDNLPSVNQTQLIHNDERVQQPQQIIDLLTKQLLNKEEELKKKEILIADKTELNQSKEKLNQLQNVLNQKIDELNKANIDLQNKIIEIQQFSQEKDELNTKLKLKEEQKIQPILSKTTQVKSSFIKNAVFFLLIASLSSIVTYLITRKILSQKRIA
jgi:hypothetical protein